MQVMVQKVRVLVPHAVEIASGEPAGAKYLTRRRTVHGAEYQLLELVIAKPETPAAADVVEMFPERVGEVGQHQIAQQVAGILGRYPLQHSAYGYMEGYGFRSAVDDFRGKYACLPQRHPPWNAGLNHNTLGTDLGLTVNIEFRSPYRIACASPMVRLATVAQLRHTSDIYHPDTLAAVGTALDGINDVLHGAEIDTARGLGKTVGVGRHHAPHMQHVVGIVHSTCYRRGVAQIAVDHLDASFQLKSVNTFTGFAMALAVPDQYSQLDAVGMRQYIVHRGATHSSGGASQKYFFLHL